MGTMGHHRVSGVEWDGMGVTRLLAKLSGLDAARNMRGGDWLGSERRLTAGARLTQVEGTAKMH